MSVPIIVSTCFDVLSAIARGDDAAIASKTTPRGRAAIAAILGDAFDERATALRGSHSVGVRYEGDRALGRFGDLSDGRFAVFVLVAEPVNNRIAWLVDDIQTMVNSAYDSFGQPDEPLGGAAPPGFAPPPGAPGPSHWAPPPPMPRKKS